MRYAQLVNNRPNIRPIELSRNEENSDSQWAFFLKQHESHTLICFVLERENKRGWTFFTYALTGSKTTLFYSRSGWTMTPAQSAKF